MTTSIAEPDGEVRSDGKLPRRRSRSADGSSSGLQSAVLVVVAVALFGAVAAMVYLRLANQRTRALGGGTAAELRDRNISFEPPPPPWESDDDTRAKLGSPIFLVYKRTEPEAYMAFGVRDFETRAPRPSELRDGLARPLNNLFDDIRPDDLPDNKWLGQPAVAYDFLARMKRDGPTIVGQCRAVAYKGIGYWSICWSGENDVKGQVATFDATRASMKLLDLREKWLPREAEVRPFGGHQLPYQLLDAEGMWTEPEKKDRPPEGEDPKADLLLMAKDKRRGMDRAHEATLVVLILDGGGDPLEEGRKYVQDQRIAEFKSAPGGLTPEFKLRTVEPEGDPTPNTVEATAPIVRLDSTVVGARSQARLMVISAIKLGEKVVVAYGWCAAGDRVAFEPKLIQIVGSLREQK